MFHRFTAASLGLVAILFLTAHLSSPAFAAPGVNITEKSGSVRIHAEATSLGEVLREIGKTTGIRFYVSPETRNQTITNEVEAPDWKTALARLLDAYNRLELWEKTLEGSEVHILSGTEDHDIEPLDVPQNNRQAKRAPTPSPAAPRRFTPPKTSGQDLPPLNRDQLMLLAKGRLRDPFPEYVFLDPDITAFLEQLNVNQNSKGEDFLKARVKARRLLKVTPPE